MKKQAFFVTGTDTEVGKTRISVGLIQCLQHAGYKTAAMKPIASGCEWLDKQWKNEDALALMKQADVTLPYNIVNPYAFEPAIAPHLAAQQAKIEISLPEIQQRFQQIAEQSEAVIVEGAGGWLVPLNAEQTMADLALTLNLPVILVVDIRLGCINHALLSVVAIQQSGLELAGWVANHTRAQAQSDAIIESLKQRISSPCLGVVPYLDEGQNTADYLSLENVE